MKQSKRKDLMGCISELDGAKTELRALLDENPVLTEAECERLDAVSMRVSGICAVLDNMECEETEDAAEA